MRRGSSLANLMRAICHNHRMFSSSTPETSLPWISPLQFMKATPSKPDSPIENPSTLVGFNRKPKFISHESAINLIKGEKDPEHALDIFNFVAEQKGFSHNHATYSTILHKLGQAKKFKAVDALLRQMSYETCRFHESIFLDLMKHFSKSSLYEKVIEMFHAIQPIVRENPSLKAISTCLNLLVDSNQVGLARNFLLHLNRSLNLKPNTCIFNIMVKHHCKSGELESAFGVVEQMKKSKISYPNLVTYTTLMNALCVSGRLEEAIELFEQMVSRDRILPDESTYNSLINGFCHFGKVDRAKKIIEFMKSNGCNPNLINYSTLMNGFSKEGKLEEAKEVFDEMKASGLRPDTVSYTALMNSFCRAGRVDDAIELLKQMKEMKCRADVVTYNVLLGGLCREGRLQEALRMLEQLAYEGVGLNKGSYRIVLNSLCQKGELERVVDLLYLMLDRGFVPHYATSNQLLVSLCEAGMANDAVTGLLELVERGFKPEPHTWALLIELTCRERKLLSAFELLDEFHLLAEFDDGKRSCRKRLAGHNQRRRKPQAGFHTGRSAALIRSYHGIAGGRCHGTSAMATSFIFQDLLPGGLLNHEKYGANDWHKHVKVEDGNDFSPLSTGPFAREQHLHSKPLSPSNNFKKLLPTFHESGASRASSEAEQYPQEFGYPISSSRSLMQDIPLGNEDFFPFGSTTNIQGSSDITDSGCARSLLSSQSQSSSSPSSRKHMASQLVVPSRSTQYSVGQVAEKLIGINNSQASSSRGVSNRFSSSAEGMHMNSILISDSIDAVNFDSMDRIYQGSQFSNAKDRVSYEDDTTMNLLQLSAQLQRVEHQKQSMPVKQGNGAFYCSRIT